MIKGKAIPLQAWTDPEGSRRLRLPDFKTIHTLPLSLKESRQANLLQVPQQGPYGERYPLTGHFNIS
jgi:hypothetical protein